MAEIPYGFFTPHSPIFALDPNKLALPDEEVSLTGENLSTAFVPPTTRSPERIYCYRKGVYNHAELEALHAESGNDWIIECNTDAKRVEAFARSFAEFRSLGDKIRNEVKPDVLIMIGDDHLEWFANGVKPTFMVYCGDHVRNITMENAGDDVIFKTHNNPARYRSQQQLRPEEADIDYPVDRDLAMHIVACAHLEEFDLAYAREPIIADNGVRVGCPYAYSFVYRRILRDAPIPFVPIMVNGYFDPQRPTPNRCFSFGQMIGRAIQSWEADKRVAVCAAGGFSHVAIDPELDRAMMDACLNGDEAFFRGISRDDLMMGNSEFKEIVTLAGILSVTNLRFRERELVFVVRSMAGVGQAMGFGEWQ